MTKGNASTVQARVTEVARLLIKGARRDEILQYCSRIYKIGDRQTDNYIQKAKEQIECAMTRSFNYDYSLAIQRYHLLFNQSIEAGNLKIAVQINKEIALLQGLMKIQIQANNKDDDPYYYRALSDDELAAEIAKHDQRLQHK